MYFIRMFPDKNKVEPGDMFKYNSTSTNLLIRNKGEDDKAYESCVRIIPFVCTRIIDQSDYMNPNVSIHIYNESTEPPFKIVGKVSRDAYYYVYDNQLLEESQINRQLYDDSGSSDYPWYTFIENDWDDKWEDQNNDSKRIQILGPCGHFH